MTHITLDTTARTHGEQQEGGLRSAERMNVTLQSTRSNRVRFHIRKRRLPLSTSRATSPFFGKQEEAHKCANYKSRHTDNANMCETSADRAGGEASVRSPDTTICNNIFLNITLRFAIRPLLLTE